MMKILIGHNHYQWAGGEDAVVKTESRMLENAGHEVCLFEADNNLIHNNGLKGIGAVKELFWSKSSYQRLRSALRAFKPDVAHFHNIYFSLTPSVYDACHDEGIAVVQSLHNFRMFCANALFFRDGHVCEDCVRKSPIEGVIHRCYKNSFLASGAVTAVTQYHHCRKTWIQKVDRYITATEFTRGKYIQAGLPAAKIEIKPNVFCPEVDFVRPQGKFVLYVGRLSEEKGVRTLLHAWEDLPHIPLKLIGEGPLSVELQSLAARKGLTHIEFLGYADAHKYNDYMQGAKFLVIPSICYENFPRIAVEAFAFGLPVLASRLGSLEEIIIEGQTGHLFDPLEIDTLRFKAQQMWQMNMDHMSLGVRDVFEQRYSSQVNLRQLLDIYARAKELK